MISTQIAKDYAHDFAKEKSRDLQREIIAGAPQFAYKPQKVKVLFLPGIDAAEVHQVYDPLKIPRQNLIGVEREREVYEELQRQNLGIRLFHGKLEDYINQYQRFDFSILSFDFTGPFNFDHRKLLSKVVGRTNCDTIVLHVANSIRREQNESKNLYIKGATYKRFCIDSLENLMFGGEVGESSVRFYNYAKKEGRRIYNGEVGKNEKEQFYAQSVLSILNDNTWEDMESILKFVFGKEYINELEKLERRLRQKRIISGDSTGLNLYKEGMFFPFETELIAKRIYDFIWDNFPAPINESVILTAEMPVELAISRTKFFLPKRVSNYSYVSESGTPMVGCIAHLEHPRYMLSLARDFVKALGFPEQMQPKNINKAKEALEKYYLFIYNISKEAQKSKFVVDKQINTVHFLGSSAKPVLTKAKAIEEFRAGRSVADVKAKYRGVNGKPLAAWKAHVTMGTYDEKPSVEEELVVYEEDSDLEIITEDEAKDFLASGIPVKEILESYPTSFSIHQLRAYEHWLRKKSGDETK